MDHRKNSGMEKMAMGYRKTMEPYSGKKDWFLGAEMNDNDRKAWDAAFMEWLDPSAIHVDRAPMNDAMQYFMQEAWIAACEYMSSQQSQGWQPIETAPKDGTPVLVYDGRNITVAQWDVDFDWWEICVARDSDCISPTLWMPLPAPPTTDKP